MEFFRRSANSTRHLGILPGSFNPVTVAHIALANAALPLLDEVVFVLPRKFPHKDFSGAPFSQRLEILGLAVAAYPQFSIASADAGLFLDIAAECREAYGAEVRQSFLCGRDAAERIVNWEYGRPGVLQEMLRHFDFLVAARGGEYLPPACESAAFRRLELNGAFDHVSASEVRNRIQRQLPWEDLAPPTARAKIAEVYGPTVARR